MIMNNGYHAFRTEHQTSIFTCQEQNLLVLGNQIPGLHVVCEVTLLTDTPSLQGLHWLMDHL